MGPKVRKMQRAIWYSWTSLQTATLGTGESDRCREVLNKSQCMIFCPPGRKMWPLAELRLKLSSSSSSSSYSSSSYGSLLLLSDRPVRCSAIHLPYPFSVVLYLLREINDNLGYCKGYFALRDFQIVGVMFKYDDRKDVPYQVSE